MTNLQIIKLKGKNIICDFWFVLSFFLIFKLKYITYLQFSYKLKYPKKQSIEHR